MYQKSQGARVEVREVSEKPQTASEKFDLMPVRRDIQSHAAQTLAPASNAHLLWFCAPSLPSLMDVHQVIEDDIAQLSKYLHQGYSIAIEPFDIHLGKCAVLQDTSGTRLCIFDKVKRSKTV